MILGYDRSIGNIAAAIDEFAPPPVTLTPNQHVLLAADWTLAVIALVTLLTLCFLWIRRGRRDPLITAPPRPNRIREDAVLIAVGAYMIIASLLSLLPGLLPDPTETDPSAIARGMIAGSATQLAAAVVCLLIAHSRFVGGVKAFLIRPNALPPTKQVPNSYAESRSSTPNDAAIETSLPPHEAATDAGLPPYQGGIEGDTPPNTEPRSGTIRTITLWVLVAGPFAIGMCLWIGELTILALEALAPTYQPSPHPTIEALQGGVSSVATIALWIGAGVVAPLAEELFFRGLLQTWLVKLLGTRWGAILLTSIVFGLIHTSQPAAIPALIALAIILGFTYEKTGVTIVPILIHALFNLKTLTWQALGVGG